LQPTPDRADLWVRSAPPHECIMIPSKLRTLRQIWAVFFFVLFVVLLLLMDYQHLRG